MLLQRSRLYLTLLTACTAGYAWLCYAMATIPANADVAGVCLIKQGIGIPCPSCGSTRSVISILHGDLLHALYLNPLGIIVFIVMAVTPFWIVYDLLTRQSSMFNWFRKTEQLFKKPAVAILLIAVLLINWIWNIIKGL